MDILKLIEDGLREMYGRTDVCLDCGNYTMKRVSSHMIGGFLPDLQWVNYSPVLNNGGDWRKGVTQLLKQYGLDLQKVVAAANGKYGKDFYVNKDGNLDLYDYGMIPELLQGVEAVLNS